MIANVLRAVARRETALVAISIAILVWVSRWGAGSQPPAAFDSYSTYDTARGGYRAAYDMLARLGVRIDRFERPPALLDDSVDTLAYVEPAEGDPAQIVPTRADVAALEAWVRGGGRLLYVGYDDVAAAAGILRLPRSFVARGRALPATIDATLRAAGVRRIVARDARRLRSLRPGTRVLVADARGPLVVAYAFGRGRVTAVVDRGLFTNAAIAAGDRARLAYALAAPGKRGGLTAFDEVPHGRVLPERWWEVIPRPLAVALALGGVALLVAFAGAAVRLGPPLAPPALDDRSSADFLVALAALFERGGDVRGALGDAAASTSHAVARALGLDAAASNERISAAISRADVRADFVRLQTIATNAYPSDANLVLGMALAQTLRKEFASYGRSRS